MEYKMKCNVCGKVFCYTDEDLKRNASNAGMQALSALGSLASTLGGGTIFHTHHLQGQADRYGDKVVDYNQCPYCHSRSISMFTVDALNDAKVSKSTNINTSAPTESLLKRAFIFLEDGDWDSASAYCEACLDNNPELAEAYLAKLMAELHVNKPEKLNNCAEPFDNNSNYQKILRYADDELKETLNGYIKQIHLNKEIAQKNTILSNGKSRMKDGKIDSYEVAITLFASISGWKDADESIQICKEKIKELKAKAEAERLERERQEEISRKKAAEQAKRNKKIAIISLSVVCAAIVFVIALNTILIPTLNRNAAIKKYGEDFVTEFESLKPGDIYKFGKYEQDNNTSNGADEIEWLVLAKENNKVLVISKFALDSQPYNSSERSTTWEECTLRTWLNQDFLHTAFSEDQQARILTTTVSADENTEYSSRYGRKGEGNTTRDQVFLLSITEAEKYLVSSNTKYFQPTEYAIANGAVLWNQKSTYLCWLRTTGADQDMACEIDQNGGIDNYGVPVDRASISVRPAMWITLNG